MDSVARKAIPNVKGMIVYDTTYNNYFFNNGTGWSTLGGAVITAGANVGDMLYWDGSKWNVAPAGKPGQFLQFDSTRKPIWSGDQYATITTLAATAITDSSATSGIDLINSGCLLDGSMASGILVSLSPITPTPSFNVNNYSFGSGTDSVALGLNTDTTKGIYSTPITTALVGGRLLINTTYYIRAYATNNAGTVFGNQISFTTLNGPVEIPQLAFLSGDPEPANGSIQLYATITNDGGSNSFSSLGLVWGTQAGVTPTTVVNNGTLDRFYDVNAILNGLVHGTTYYYMIYATNSAGTGYSPISSFYYQ